MEERSEEEIPKRYYSIREVAELLELPTSKLRYWESEFPQLNPAKNASGHRRYTPEDVETVRLISYLLNIRKYTLQGAREKLAMNPKDLDYQLKTRQTLERIRNFLAKLEESI